MKAKVGVYQEAGIIQNEDKSFYLDLPDLTPEDEEYKNLPKVSVVTITKNRKNWIASMLYIWNKYVYPKDKLEWVIVDDSETDELQSYLPDDDPRIKYYYFKEHMPVDEKRNKAVELASHELIAHMDDDDFYFEDSILAKVRVMQKYKKEGVLGTTFGIYDLITRDSYVVKGKLQTNNIGEATLLYKKSYWNTRKFKGEGNNGTNEGRNFIGKNFHKFVSIHFLFNTVSITHNTNFTGELRRVDMSIAKQETQETVADFYDVFPDTYITILENIRSLIIDIPQQKKTKKITPFLKN